MYFFQTCLVDRPSLVNPVPQPTRGDSSDADTRAARG
jgi:hypothetical protein